MKDNMARLSECLPYSGIVISSDKTGVRYLRGCALEKVMKALPGSKWENAEDGTLCFSLGEAFGIAKGVICSEEEMADIIERKDKKAFLENTVDIAIR